MCVCVYGVLIQSEEEKIQCKYINEDFPHTLFAHLISSDVEWRFLPLFAFIIVHHDLCNAILSPLATYQTLYIFLYTNIHFFVVYNFKHHQIWGQSKYKHLNFSATYLINELETLSHHVMKPPHCDKEFEIFLKHQHRSQCMDRSTASNCCSHSDPVCMSRFV